MPATLHAINQNLLYDFGRTEYTSGCAPAIYYVGLSTTVLDSSASVIAEPADAVYVRVPYANTAANWDTPVAGSIVNTTSASFMQSTEAWGTFYSMFLADGKIDAAGSKVWYYQILSPALIIGNNTIITLDEGTITATKT